MDEPVPDRDILPQDIAQTRLMTRAERLQLALDLTQLVLELEEAGAWERERRGHAA